MITYKPDDQSKPNFSMRAHRMLKKDVQRGRSKRGAEAYRGPVALQIATGEGYVEGPSARPIAQQGAMGAPTKLAAFFNILPCG